jgi:hypothetical protein
MTWLNNIRNTINQNDVLFILTIMEENIIAVNLEDKIKE